MSHSNYGEIHHDRDAGFVLLCALMALSFAVSLFIERLPVVLGGYADQRIFQCLISFLIFSIGACFVLRENRFRLIALDFVGVSLLVLWIVGTSILSMPQEHKWVEPIWYSLYFLAFVFGGLFLSLKSMVSRVSQFFIFCATFSAFLYGLMALNIYAFLIIDGKTDLKEYIPWGFVNVRYWSHLATWMMPLVTLSALHGRFSRKRTWRLIPAVGATLWWWMLYTSSSRGSVLGILFGAFLIAVIFGSRSFPLIKRMAQYAFFGAVLWFALSFIIPSIITEEVQVRAIKLDDSSRLPMVIESWEMSLVQFPFGMGPQSWLTHELITDQYSAAPKFAHPHNMYLMWAAEYGWGFIVALGLLVLIAINRFFKKRAFYRRRGERKGEIFLMAFSASVAGALFHAGASAVFISPASMVVGGFVLAIFWGLIFPESEGISDRNADSGGFKVSLVSSLCLVAVLSVGTVWLSQVWEYYKAMEYDRDFSLYGSAQGKLPRFWFHGNYPRAPAYME